MGWRVLRGQAGNLEATAGKMELERMALKRRRTCGAATLGKQCRADIVLLVFPASGTFPNSCLADELIGLVDLVLRFKSSPIH
jgi:hypothetical protein